MSKTVTLYDSSADGGQVGFVQDAGTHPADLTGL